MKLFKSLLIVITSLLAIGFQTQAATVFYNPTSTNVTSVVAAQGRLGTITFANNASSATQVSFFDSPTNVVTWVNSAFTNRTQIVGTTVHYETNFFGRITAYTNATVTTSLGVQPAATNNYRVLYTYVVPATTSHTLTIDPSIYFQNGIAATTTATNVIVTINYGP